MSKKIVRLEEELAVLRLSYDRLMVKAKGRRKAIKDMNRFVKFMRQNDAHLTAKNEQLTAIIEDLNLENKELMTKLEQSMSYVES